MLVNIFLSDIEKGRLKSIYTWACGEHSEQKDQRDSYQKSMGQSSQF